MSTFKSGLLMAWDTSGLRNLAALVLVLVIAGCSKGGSGESNMKPTPVARVAVFQDGRITIDGRELQIADVRVALEKLARNKGVMWYYREGASAEPHPNALLVIQAAIDARLPVSMSTKADYSDVVTPDGVKPR